jgi:hypothetical protein
MQVQIGKKSLFFFVVLFLVVACQKQREAATTIPADLLFSTMPEAVTGIDFINKVTYTEDYNPYTFRNFFNGGGVGLGDVNNDGLIDVFFCANMSGNQLYLNKGNFQFENITNRAGLASKNVWSSGVAMADVNGDGLLDIYVCKSGRPEGKRRYNELFINNGNLTFTEQAKEYGLADLGLSTHAAFFDYDRDGDLDCYLLNNSVRSVGGYDLIKNQRLTRDKKGGNRLYRNDGKTFTDVSAEAGIYGSNIGFGLGVTIGDTNRDGWPDIYVSNDFFERDYLYLNNKNGTFTEVLEDQFQEISQSSMGADMADLNNDGFPDIFVTDMLPAKEARMKTKTNFEDWNKYQSNVRNGYFRQFTRNVLQINNQDNTFSEIGRMAGTYATDWSWGALIADLDNDRNKDIFVANGLLRDLTDQDYVNFYSNPAVVRQLIHEKKGQAVITKMVDAMPSSPIANFAFQNQGNLHFVNQAQQWGLGEPSFSNGSAYGDLDNDGDLDLVVNNINMPAFVYRNNTNVLRKGKGNFLNIQLKGAGKNPFAIGAQVTIRHQGQTLFQELFPMRGFESCVDARLNFGLGDWTMVDTLVVAWPNGKYTLKTQIKAGERLKLQQSSATLDVSPLKETHFATPLFSKITPSTGIDFKHEENEFSDFDRDRLLFQMYSADGPKMAVGDVNRDGREDFYVGGAKEEAGALFLQQANGQFKRSAQPAFENDKSSEDTDAAFFDADGDRDLDLYVCSGGNEFPSSSFALANRLYFNDGRGQFTRSNQILPTFQFESTSCVDPGDFDGDGDLDLFVGVRLKPFLYGAPVNGYVLKNDGKGNFQDVTKNVAPTLLQCGLITDGRWVDTDGDRDLDLVVCGEWMPIKVFRNDQGRFTETTQEAGFEKSNGFWNCVEPVDIDGDGDQDLVLGNLGLNSRFKASATEPIDFYLNDFDANGTAEQIICMYQDGKSCPIALLPDLVKQIPSLRKKYLQFSSYPGQTMLDIFGAEGLKKAIHWQVFITQSALAINQGKGKFALQILPDAAQVSPVFGILAKDFDQDGKMDLLLGGNFSRAKPETGVYMSSYGQFLKGLGNAQFAPLIAKQSGFQVKGEIRDLKEIRSGNQKRILVAKNNDWMEVFLVK